MADDGGLNSVKPELLEPYLASGQLTKHESELLRAGHERIANYTAFPAMAGLFVLFPYKFRINRQATRLQSMAVMFSGSAIFGVLGMQLGKYLLDTSLGFLPSDKIEEKKRLYRDLLKASRASSTIPAPPVLLPLSIPSSSASASASSSSSPPVSSAVGVPSSFAVTDPSSSSPPPWLRNPSPFGEMNHPRRSSASASSATEQASDSFALSGPGSVRVLDREGGELPTSGLESGRARMMREKEMARLREMASSSENAPAESTPPRRSWNPFSSRTASPPDRPTGSPA